MDGVGQCAASDSDSLCHCSESVAVSVISLPLPSFIGQASQVIDSMLQEKWEKSFFASGSLLS